jgi:uncharacterized membrane protein (UPF0136 family)
MSDLWPWLTLFGLGAFHGLNPAMGWLFAVALGLQEQQREAVFRALPPIALGHALSVGAIVAAALLLRASVSHTALRLGAATLLFAFGAYRLVRSRHPKWVGMRVGFKDLTLWSFIMASAHGAGLMLIPLFIWPGTPRPALYASRIHSVLPVEPICTTAFSSFSAPSLLAISVAVHTAGHFLVAGVMAWVVYQKLGVAILRHAWFNVDLFWTISLVVTGALILVL